MLDYVKKMIPANVIEKMRPYIELGRFDKPIGIWLLLFPAWWGAAFAENVFIDIWIFFLLLAGAAVMRAAGCTYNDIVDRNLDKEVARTQTRPLANGSISLPRAILFMTLLLLIGLVVLLQFNRLTIFIGALSLIPVALYPFMKRITYWPQAFLGLTFNWGALVGYTAITGSLALTPLVVYIAGFFWTLGYDTVYAHQDKKDDQLIGIKSSALKLGNNTRLAVFIFYAVMVGLLAFAGSLNAFGTTYFVSLLAATAILFYQAGFVDLDNPASCLEMFKLNQWVGLILFLGILSA